MNQKPNIFKGFIVAVIALIACIAVGGVLWLAVGQQQKTHKIEKGLDRLDISQMYAQVSSVCANEEGTLKCERGYLTTDPLTTVRSAMIQKLKSAGYTLYDMPNGFDGPYPTFFARNQDLAIVIKTVKSDNAAYTKANGALQLTAYSSGDIADNRFNLGAQL